MSTLIDGTASRYPFWGGGSRPFKSSGGDFYCVLTSNNGKDIEVWKASDPTSSWSEEDASNIPVLGFSAQALAVAQEGDDLHIATIHTDTSGMSDVHDVEYHTFDMATDTWGTTGESVHASISDNDGNVPPAVAIATRTGSDTNFNVVIAYTAPIDTSMGTDYARWSYKVRNGSWGSEQALDSAGNVHWGGGAIGEGTSDRLHFIFENRGVSEIYQRTLTSADSLETIPSGTTLGVFTPVYTSNMVSFNDGGTQRVWGLISATAFLGEDEQTRVELDSADTPGNVTLTSVSDENPYLETPGAIANDGTDVYVVFSGGGFDGAERDVYYDKNNTTDVEHADGVDVLYVNANVYERSGTKVGLVQYEDTGSGYRAYYDEIDIGAGGDVQPSKLMLMGVGI